jgi:hypothetical protein
MRKISRKNRLGRTKEKEEKLTAKSEVEVKLPTKCQEKMAPAALSGENFWGDPDERLVEPLSDQTGTWPQLEDVQQHKATGL